MFWSTNVLNEKSSARTKSSFFVCFRLETIAFLSNLVFICYLSTPSARVCLRKLFFPLDQRYISFFLSKKAKSSSETFSEFVFCSDRTKLETIDRLNQENCFHRTEKTSTLKVDRSHWNDVFSSFLSVDLSSKLFQFVFFLSMKSIWKTARTMFPRESGRFFRFSHSDRFFVRKGATFRLVERWKTIFLVNVARRIFDFFFRIKTAKWGKSIDFSCFETEGRRNEVQALSSQFDRFHTMSRREKTSSVESVDDSNEDRFEKCLVEAFLIPTISTCLHPRFIVFSLCYLSLWNSINFSSICTSFDRNNGFNVTRRKSTRDSQRNSFRKTCRLKE